MKKTTKLAAILLAIGVLASGCGTSTGSNDQTPAEAQGETSSAAPEAVQETEENADTTDKIVIKAATGGTPKPYVFLDENGQPAGFDIEVINEIFNRLPDYELEIVVTDFASIFSGLSSGSYQIGVNSFTYNAERAQTYLYSYPYDKNAYVFVTKNGAQKLSSFEEAAGLTTEGNAGGAISNGIEAWNEKFPDKAINLQYTESDTTVLLQHVEDGLIDFAIMDPAMYKTYLEEYSYDVQATDLDEESVAMISDNLNAYLLFPQDQQELREVIDEVIKDLKEDGTLTRLTEKWFDRDLAPDDDQYEETIN